MWQIMSENWSQTKQVGRGFSLGFSEEKVYRLSATL